MSVFKVLVVIGLYAAMAACQSEDQSGLSPEVQELCDSFFNWRVKSMPQFATFVGIHNYNEELDDLSEDAYQKRYDESKDFLQKVQDLQPTLEQAADLLNIEVLRDQLQTFIDGYKYKGFYLPVNNMEGPHIDTENLLGWMPKSNYSDYEVILTRFRKMPHQFDQMIALMKKGVESGITYHKNSMDGLMKSFEKFATESPEDSPLYASFSGDFPEAMSTAEISQLQTEAKQVIQDEVTPAYAKLIDYISKEYINRENISAASLPNGTEYYNQLIRFHTSTNMTADDIQKVGYAEVEEIEKKMMEIVNEMGHENMSVQEFSDVLRKDTNNFYNTSEELMARFEEINYQIIPPHLTPLFKTIPTIKLEIASSPSPDSPGAIYLSSSYDGSRPGVFYVNNHHLETQPKYAMMTLSLHEASPGHHLQGSHSIESSTMPFFRMVGDDRNYGLNPTNFPQYTGYTEGWALYSEGLGFDMNLYDDPLDRYGHYSEEIFRACRLVVDTGMHAFGWSREQAMDYMYQHTASSRTEVEREIDRYITWPGQALAYKIGQLKMRNLRAHAEETLGDKFELKGFHEVVLESVGPLSIVEENVNKWVDKVAAQN